MLFGEYGEDIVVGNMETKASFSLTGVAADMWKAVVEHGTLEAAVATLSNEYEVDEGVLRADLRGFVEDLLARDLLERSDVSTFHQLSRTQNGATASGEAIVSTA